ncbi:zinc ribbon domain-containing protein [Micromonospora eburnea]|uniref:zinc ribbon domain-containing protein n=1 Tax=Micromonospora eburnea TaxID=227316 RepID=UPI001ABFDB02|nr:zinc ribbon domain-containing protein [Micromonospora eburnea]
MISKEITHTPIIDDNTFEQAQTLLNKRARRLDTPRRRPRTRNPYIFRGMLYCAACHRRMQGQYNHGAAYYRCRFPRNTPSPTTSRTPATSTSEKTPSPNPSTPGSPPHSHPTASNKRSPR